MFNFPVQMGIDIATSLSVIFACFVFIINQIKERKIAHKQRSLELLEHENSQRQRDFEQALVFVSKGYVDAYEKFVKLVSQSNQEGTIQNTVNEIVKTADELIQFNENLIMPFLMKCEANKHLNISLEVHNELHQWNKNLIKSFKEKDVDGVRKFSEPVRIVGKSIVDMYMTKIV